MNLTNMYPVSWYSLIITSSLSGLFAKYSIEFAIGLSLRAVKKETTVEA